MNIENFKDFKDLPILQNASTMNMIGLANRITAVTCPNPQASWMLVASPSCIGSIAKIASSPATVRK